MLGLFGELGADGAGPARSHRRRSRDRQVAARARIPAHRRAQEGARSRRRRRPLRQRRRVSAGRAHPASVLQHRRDRRRPDAAGEGRRPHRRRSTAIPTPWARRCSRCSARCRKTTGSSELPVTERRQRVFAALMWLAGRMTADRPLVLAYEDLQWVTSDTRDFLDAFAHNLPPSTLVLLTYRPDYDAGVARRSPAARTAPRRPHAGRDTADHHRPAGRGRIAGRAEGRTAQAERRQSAVHRGIRAQHGRVGRVAGTAGTLPAGIAAGDDDDSADGARRAGGAHRSPDARRQATCCRRSPRSARSRASACWSASAACRPMSSGSRCAGWKWRACSSSAPTPASSRTNSSIR